MCEWNVGVSYLNMEKAHVSQAKCNVFKVKC